MSSKKALSANTQLKSGIILSYVVIIINIVSALFYSPWMLSVIGDGDYGLYTLATSLINMFLLDFGISSAVTRFTSKYVAEGRQDKVDQLLGVIFKLFGAIAVIICLFLIIIYFFIDNIYVSLTASELAKFKVVYLISAAYSVVAFPFTMTLNGILTSYEKFIQIKICDILNKVLTVVLIVVALLTGHGLYALVTINAALNLVCFFAKWILIKRGTPVKVKVKFWDKNLLKEIFGFSIWVLINSICSRLIMNVCPSILGITSGTKHITIFGFAAAIEGYCYMFASAIDGMFMPRIARITYRENDMNGIYSLMLKVGRFQYHLIGLIVVGFICVGRQFVTLWIGEQYWLVYPCALLLLLPTPSYMSQQIGKNTMVMTNKIKYLSFVNIIKAVGNVVFVYLLSMFWGTLGACISICFFYFFRNIANMYLFKKKLNLDMKSFFIQCYGKMTAAIVLCIVLGYLVSVFNPIKGWIGMLLSIFVIIVAYFILMWFIAYNQQEKAFIKSFLTRLKRRT